MKLLHYTSLRHLLFASLLTVLSIPLFYILLNNIFVHSIDRDLKMQAEKIPSTLSLIQTPEDLELWRTLDNDLKIVPKDSITLHKSPYTIQKSIAPHKSPEDYRIFQKEVNIMGRPYIVAIESSLFEKEDLVRTILLIQLGILVLLLLGTVAINYLINKKVWQPFYEALSYLKAFNIEVTTEALQLPNPIKIKEFKELCTSIKLQAARVRNAYSSQKEFIENASHELQTPLTVLKFKLELLLQSQNLTEQQGELTSDMYREIEQMQELSRNLLLLSRIENGQFAPKDNIDAVAIIQEIIEELTLLAEAKEQRLILTQHPQISLISINEVNQTLFKIMIRGLLTNAIRYSVPKASIQIELRPEAVEIVNPGLPIKLSQGKLFKRFMRHSGQKGNGLGLSIVASIAKLHKFRLDYNYDALNGMHHFSIHWSKKAS